jgi:phosphate:Na+ symporter
MSTAISVLGGVPGIGQSRRATAASSGANATSGAAVVSTEEALVQLERSATQLEELQRSYRGATLGAVANGTLSADAAIVRVETVRSSKRWRITPGAP